MSNPLALIFGYYRWSFPTWIKDGGTTIVKPKEKLNRDEKERLKKNARPLCILQCSLHNDIFNYVCSCEIVNELWGRLLLLYKNKNEKMWPIHLTQIFNKILHKYRIV